MSKHMEMIDNSLKRLKIFLSTLSGLFLFIQLYFVTFKLPFDLTFSNKRIGFFEIYFGKLLQNFALWPPVFYFILAHAMLQAIVCAWVYFTIKSLMDYFEAIKKSSIYYGVILWVICQLNLFFWNATLFPYSYFSFKLLKYWVTSLQGQLILFILSSMILLLSCHLLNETVRRLTRKKIKIIGIGFIVGLGIYLINLNHQKPFTNTQKPNVIVIITDSLRPDYVQDQNRSQPKELGVLLKRSSYFNNSLALLGRSTPGLITILTGNYPKTNGARFNLISSDHLKMENSLTTILKRNGYQTIFLADGRQFINLDPHFGFDQIISAKSGVYDFIFTFMNDIPLANLIMNTRLGGILFPYNYANRNAYYTYLPKTFSQMVEDRLVNKGGNKPVFIVSALTIAHWPYAWANQPDYSTLEERYQDSVQQLDQQFSQLMGVFEKKGLLKNYIMVILSDHGDSLGLPGDRIISQQHYQGIPERLSLIPKAPYTTVRRSCDAKVGIDTCAGHGTDLLSMTQLQTTLAFYLTNRTPQTFNERVALIDVAPTLLDLLKLKKPLNQQGISLEPLMNQKELPKTFDRPIFLESEIDIPLIDVTQTKENSSAVKHLISQYASLYDINLKSQQLILKEDAIPSLLNQKQRAVIYRNWLLSYFPGKNAVQTDVLPANSPLLNLCYYTFSAEKKNGIDTQLFCVRSRPTKPYYVLVNLTTKKWEIFWENESAQNSTFSMMLGKLKSFYRGEL